VRKNFNQIYEYLCRENPRSTLGFAEQHRVIGEWLYEMKTYEGPFDAEFLECLVALHRDHQVQLYKMKSAFCRKEVR